MKLCVRAAGDLLLGDVPPDMDHRGLQALVGRLRGGDLAFGNMECPMIDSGLPIPKGDIPRTGRWAGPVLQQMGFAMAVAVLLDALVVRSLAVPAAMSLLGARAWWLPAALERHLPRLHTEGRPESEPEAAPALLSRP